MVCQSIRLTECNDSVTIQADLFTESTILLHLQGNGGWFDVKNIFPS
jgi:hypothetical protein